MFKIIGTRAVLLFGALLFLSLACSQDVKNSNGGDIDVTTFEELMEQKNVQLVDVRTPQEFGEGYIDGAVNFDFYGDNFDKQMMTLDPDKPLLLYCRSGNRSGQAMEMMQDRSFKEVYNLDGGIIAWKKAGNQVK